MEIGRNFRVKAIAVLLATLSCGAINSNFVKAAGDNQLTVGQADARDVLGQYDGFVDSKQAIRSLGRDIEEMSIDEFWKSIILDTLRNGGSFVREKSDPGYDMILIVKDKDGVKKPFVVEDENGKNHVLFFGTTGEQLEFVKKYVELKKTYKAESKSLPTQVEIETASSEGKEARIEAIVPLFIRLGALSGGAGALGWMVWK